MAEQHQFSGPVSRVKKFRNQGLKNPVSESCATEHNSHLRRIASIALGLAVLVIFSGCEKDPSLKTDAELGLNVQQAQGRHVFQLYCAICHSAYTSKSLKGPSLKGVFQKEYLP